MTLSVLAPWVLTAFVALAGFFVTFRQQRSLRLPRCYLGFVALAAMGQFVLWFFWPSRYDFVFWVLEVANDILLCLVSLETIWHLLRQHRIVYLWVYLGLVLAVAEFLNQDRGTTIQLLLNVSVAANIVSGILLGLLLFVPQVHWTAEDRLVTAGTAVAMFSSLVPLLFARPYFQQSLPEFSGFLVIVRSVAQVAPLISLVLLSVAGRFKMQSRHAHA